jgi:hypothetical protein
VPALLHNTLTEDCVPVRPRASKAITANLLQPTQMLVGIAMVARGEFAYLVAETAQGLDWRGSGTPMMASEVYASVIIALVCATVCAPIMFRWVLGVFDRASPIHRSEYIGGGKERFARRAFVIRLAGAYSPGVQREIFDALHSSGVDILEASLVTVRKDDSPEADVKSFINNFIVMSRGKKKVHAARARPPCPCCLLLAAACCLLGAAVGLLRRPSMRGWGMACDASGLRRREARGDAAPLRGGAERRGRTDHLRAVRRRLQSRRRARDPGLWRAPLVRAHGTKQRTPLCEGTAAAQAPIT